MSHRPRLLPLLATALGIALFAVMDALMKRASIAGGVYAALLLRCAVALVVLVPVWLISGGRLSAPGALKVHALRGAVACAMAATFFYGLVRTPMAPAIALSFAAPLIALYLAAVMLGETVRRAAVAGSLVALAGVAVIAASRIDRAALEGEAALGLAAIMVSTVLYAWNLVLQRQQALLAQPLEIALFQNLVIGALLLPLAPLLWHPAALPAWGDVAGSAALATGSLMLLAWAYARAEAQVLVPVEYTAFVWAALMGWVMFAEPVDAATLGGVALIMGGVWWSVRQ